MSYALRGCRRRFPFDVILLIFATFVFCSIIIRGSRKDSLLGKIINLLFTDCDDYRHILERIGAQKSVRQFVVRTELNN